MDLIEHTPANHNMFMYIIRHENFQRLHWFQCFCFFFSWFHCILLLQFALFLVFSAWIGHIHLGFMSFLEHFQCFSTKAIFMSALCVFSGACDMFHTRFYLILNIINVAYSDLFKVKVRNIISLDQREIWKVKGKDMHTHTKKIGFLEGVPLKLMWQRPGHC